MREDLVLPPIAGGDRREANEPTKDRLATDFSCAPKRRKPSRAGLLWRWLRRLLRSQTLFAFDLLGVVLGVLGKQFFDSYLSGQPGPISLAQIAFATIIGFVMFPAIYQGNKEALRRLPGVVRFTLAFSLGFAWKTILGQIQGSHVP